MSLELVLKIFIRTLVTVNSSDLTSVRFTGHASSAYNEQGKHLRLSKCRTVSSEADLPIFPNIALKLRKKDLNLCDMRRDLDTQTKLCL